MPGEQADLSQYSQQERDDCAPLQEAFRKGELICIGMGYKGNPEKRLEEAKERILKTQAHQPLVPVLAEDRPFEFDPASPSKAEHLEPVFSGGLS